jgi:hypothetical protein
MSNIRIIRSFTKSERQRLELIQSIYRECVEGKELPVQLRLEKKKPQYKAGVRDFVATTWINQMGKGVLKPMCEAIVNEICEYQKERSERVFGSGYRDDPYVLFLEEIKDWITQRVSVLDCNIEARDMLKARIRYMDHVLSEANLFDPFPTHKSTMQQVVTRSKRILKYEMLPIVEAEIAHSSAREDLRQLQISVSAALSHLVSFLYNIFRSGSGPVTITISKLRTPVGEKYEKIKQNRAGYLLHRLMNSGLFSSVFLDDHFQLEDERKAVADGMTNQRLDVVSSNDFLDARGNVRIPKWLLEFVQDPKERAAIDLTNVFDHEDSGVESFFRGKAMITGCFLRCHGLAQELAKFVLVVEKAHRLAGQGGDLLVYGVANAQVNAMLQTYESLSRAVRQQVDRLNQMAEIHFEQLVNDNQARESSSKWVKHFKKVSFTLELLDGDLQRADEAALHVRAQANALTLHQRLQKAKTETENFVVQAEGYSRHVAGVLGIEYQPAIVPAVVSIDNALTVPDAPMGRLLAESASSSFGQFNAGGYNTAGIGGSYQTPLGIAAAPVNPLGAVLSGSNLSTLQAAGYNSSGGALVPTGANYAPSPNSGFPPNREVNAEDLIMVKQGITDNSLNRVLIRLTPAVVRISLENNRLTGSGALALFEHVAKYCPSVKSINLYNNNLGPEGARALAAALTRPDHSLTRLDLNSNDIGDEGAQYIIGGLLANRTLTHLDLGYNGLTDRGIEDLKEVISAEDSVLKFLKISGNEFTAASLTPILALFERNPNFVEIDIGDPTDKVPPGLADKFKAVTHPRRHAWNAALQAKYDAERAKAAEPKLKRIEGSNAGGGPPLLKTKAKSPKEPVMVGANASGSQGGRAQGLSSGPTVEELPDDFPSSSSPSVGSGSGASSSTAYSAQADFQYTDDEMTEVELQVEDYYPLIRVLQLLIPVCKTKQYGCIAKKELRKAFEVSAYGIKLPDITMTIEEYYEAARAAGVVELREIKKKGAPAKIGLALTDQWKKYAIPKPANIAKINNKAWSLFIQCCKLKPNAQHKKSSIARWARTVKTELQNEAEDVLSAMVELSIYSATMIMDLSAGKYTPNLTQKRYPIDLSVCPKFEF